MEKWPFLEQNHGLTPLEKCQFFWTFWTCFFYSLEFRVFVLEHHKRHFPGLYCLKKKIWNMAIFGPKPWVNSFGKMTVFRVLNFLFLWQAFFRSRISLNTFSWPILAKKKKLKKWPFFDQNHGLTSFEKCQFLDFLIFLFLKPRKAFFRSRIS